MTARRANQLFLVHVLVAGLGLALLVGAGAVLAAGIDLELPSSAAIRAACDGWLASGGPLAVVVLAVLSLALLSIGLGLRSVWRQLAHTRRYLSAQSIVGERTVAGRTCALTQSPLPLAFCAGYLRPRIHLSLGAVEQLSEAELHAVVDHEHHHLRRRDPLRLLLGRALADALFFIPLLRRTAERYEALGELAADEEAVSRAAGRGALASAIVKFDDATMRGATVVGVAPERVDHLMGDPDARGWRLPRASARWGAVALLALGGLFLLSWQIDSAAQLPLLVAAGCIALMVGGPIALAVGAVVLSRRALRVRRS
jgi:hypothetical protein